jgi:hypothetical protein
MGIQPLPIQHKPSVESSSVLNQESTAELSSKHVEKLNEEQSRDVVLASEIL